MSSIYDWSTTASDNGTADGSINFAEGQAPSTLNNSSRQAMGRVAELVKDLGGALAAGGTANAITATANSAFTAYATGVMLAFTAVSDNTGATTLDVNSLGAKSIRKFTGSGEAALSGAEIQGGGIYVVRYNSALNSAAGGWQLMNPSQGALGTMSTQDATAVAITGGAIDGATVGATTAAAGKFTTLGASGVVSLADGSAGTPALVFSSDTNTGLSSGGADILRFSTGGTTRGRIVANGDWWIGGESYDGTNMHSIGLNIQGAGATNPGSISATVSGFAAVFLNREVSDGHIMEFFASGGFTGDISVSSATSTTAYNTSSDRRLKTNLKPFDSGALIDAIETWEFDWVTGGHGHGVIAQDCHKVFPEAITPGEGDKIWTADYSKFVPLLLAEVKALRARLKSIGL